MRSRRLDAPTDIPGPPALRREHRGHVVAAWFSETGLKRLLLTDAKDTRAHRPLSPPSKESRALSDALDRYLSGRREDFSDIPIDPAGATEFQREVWNATRRVGWGETETYAGVSERLGRGRNAARAVGQALHVNPIPIVVPCHRVIAAHGGLGGFGAGMEWKRILLEVEGLTGIGVLLSTPVDREREAAP